MTDHTPLLETRPTVMEVNLKILGENLAKLRSAARGAKVMAVVKANAYGHGLEEVALNFEACGVDALGCAYLEEALILRQAGVRVPILVFGGLVADQVDRYITNDIDLTASSLSKLEQIELTASRLRKRARVHLKIDTGMERLGTHYYSADALLNRVLTLEWCDVAGIYSHLAGADRADQDLTNLQLERFLSCAEFFNKHSLPAPTRHLANSAAIMMNPETCLDMVRPGIALYGVMPSADVPNTLELQPAMSITSKVVYFKVVKQDSGISYNHLWKAPEDTRVVTIPIGYGDGYPRALTNRSEVIIHQKKFPVVGAICMDQLMVNVGKGEAYNGDEVVLLGKQGGESIDVSELSEKSGRIPYEILVGLNTRIPRRYLR